MNLNETTKGRTSPERKIKVFLKYLHFLIEYVDN